MSINFELLKKTNDEFPAYSVPHFQLSHYTFQSLDFNRRVRSVLLYKECYISFDISKNYMYEFYLFDKDGELVKELSFGKDPVLYEVAYYEEDSVAFLEDFFVQFNICHYLLDKLPRFYEFEDESIKKVVLFRNNEYVQTLLSKLALSPISLNYGKKFTVKFERLFISSSSFTTGSFIHPGQNLYQHTHDLINKVSENIKPLSSNKRIIIDRSNSPSRKVINTEELNSLLIEYGIEAIKLEELSFDEQVQLFKSAELVIAVHGAGLTNIAFCQKDTVVIEIIPPLCATQAFAKLAISKKLNYIPIVGIDKDFKNIDYSNWQHNPAKYNRRDIIMPIQDIKKAIDSFNF